MDPQPVSPWVSRNFPTPNPYYSLTSVSDSVGITGPQCDHCGDVSLFGEALVRSNKAKELWEVLLDGCGALGPGTRPPS